MCHTVKSASTVLPDADTSLRTDRSPLCRTAIISTNLSFPCAQDSSVLPALLDRLSYTLGVLFPVVLVKIARFDVRRARRVRIIQQTAHTTSQLGFINDHFEHLRSHATSLSIKAHSRREHSPLNTRQNRRDIIRRTPPILQNIQAQLPSIINIRMEHLANKLDARRFVWVLFFEVHDESECAVFERRVRRPDDDCVPVHAVESAAIRPR